jgi:hypothetical protein
MKAPPDIVIGTINRCIYCGNDGSSEKLTAEHIIPLSFGGHRVINAASCAKCRDATHAIEGQCCGTMFKALRVHKNMRTRRPKKRPTHLTVLDGKTPEGAPIREIPVDTAPGFVPFPIFGPPQIFSNSGAPVDRVDFQGAVICTTTNDALARQKALVEGGMTGALAYSDVPLSSFIRTLAKIAHGYAVSHQVAGFTPILSPTILGHAGHFGPHYVGGLGNLPNFIALPDPKLEGLHQVSCLTIAIRGQVYLAVQIRLFAKLTPTPPVYVVIAGLHSGPHSAPHVVIA